MSLYDTTSDSDAEYHQPQRKRRRFKTRINFGYLTDPHEYKEKFRICAEAMEFLLERIGDDLQSPTTRNKALTPAQKLMISLHWMGNGGQYHGIADMHGIHKTTVQRCLKQVCASVLEKLFPEMVRWPNPPNTEIARRFFDYAGFPRVAGCIDGSLIPIDGPGGHESAYVDRHGNHSINCLVVCGPDLEFYYASARWPGSVHDSRVLRNSSLFDRWQEGWRPFPGAILLGDSGFTLMEWLLTPIERRGDPVGIQRYLRRHKSTRRLVECALGVLKEKFPCLNHLRLVPQFSAKVILSCITIHNVQKLFANEDYDREQFNDEIDDDAPSQENPSTNAITIYDEIVRIFTAESG